jgi:hypothetical protein
VNSFQVSCSHVSATGAWGEDDPEFCGNCESGAL